ncbi:hypothetical protein BX661DRAFT_14209 [Kickxella alabastrina]|uniref:uncharacterized protein n=1 Tax=Kickxella alabastrina TaxID=61397 RepID=UPI00221E6A7B|nr:uncharacterized protein BX661DRAFT_14209 [Kickxella alabastrina]KAI7828430.1 hypothetical protein BX661DRAFT_14209 [Kickxella alabastrina]
MRGGWQHSPGVAPRGSGGGHRVVVGERAGHRFHQTEEHEPKLQHLMAIMNLLSAKRLYPALSICSLPPRFFPLSPLLMKCIPSLLKAVSLIPIYCQTCHHLLCLCSFALLLFLLLFFPCVVLLFLRLQISHSVLHISASIDNSRYYIYILLFATIILSPTFRCVFKAPYCEPSISFNLHF